MNNFFHENDSILKKIKITKASVHIEYYMTSKSPNEIDQIIEHCQQSASIMRYIGIYRFEINGVTILDDQHEDDKYSFEYGLIMAAEDGICEAVNFLIDLGTTSRS
jgi:hypothetical protein